MALPTFLTPAQLQAVELKLDRMYNEMNEICSMLGVSNELNLLQHTRTASGKIWLARQTVQNVRQSRTEDGK